MKSNPGYKPFHKKQVVIWIGNRKELETTKGGIILTAQDVENKLSRAQEGIIVDMSAGCFEGDDWDSRPKIGDEVCFRGYVGSIYEHNDDFYRIMEDKFLTAPSIK